MRRKYLMMIVICGLALSACGSKTPEPAAVEVVEDTAEDIMQPKTEETEPAASDESMEQVTPEELTTEPEAPAEPTLSDIESYLQDRGVLVGERVQKAGELIGAVEGVGYDNCEIYLFDTDSDAYKKAVNGEELFVEGMESFGGFKFDAVNGPYALLLKGGSSDLVDAFNSYK